MRDTSISNVKTVELGHGRVIVEQLRELADAIENGGIASVGPFMILAASPTDGGFSMSVNGNVPPEAAVSFLATSIRACEEAVAKRVTESN